jgi:eukaryotic-like serine/threonine-protein kinase
MGSPPADESDLGSSRSETLLSPRRSPRAPSSASIDGGRFAAGTILDGRYRIVGLLGRGGMGEVYRAEDLKLGEPTALKFLPLSLRQDGAALARLHREVRTARQITHRNVVRVHDVGEVDGQPFLTMEYIPGEDLSSLLRRIGRLPEDKAVQLARQLCAGLAAAHDRGVIHRDLKPANVMIDHEGHAKISDFGLAGLAAELAGREVAGTPAYMAPEQLLEGRVSFASDIYSLGLLLYEMFTGRRAFEAASREDLERLHRETSPASISASIEGIDPRLEALVRRCLDPATERRPSSAIQVAAALPGGDPVAAALAAGETPSPEMVARAGGQRALSGGLAAAVLAGTLGSLALALYCGSEVSALRFDPPLEPQVLRHRAQEVLRTAGWEGSDSAYTYDLSPMHALRSALESHSLAGWRDLAARRPTFTEFVYREARGPLAPRQRWTRRVYADDPPPGTPGVATARLDGQGRLRELLLPGLDRPPGAAAAEPDWTPWFEAAELDPASLQAIEPLDVPPIYADVVRSWTGTYPGQDEPPIRVEAGAMAGRVVYWRVKETPAGGASAAAQGEGGEVFVLTALVVFGLFLLVGAFFARRHLRTGRGDPRGAQRLAICEGLVVLGGWLLYGSHVAAPAELSLGFAALAQALLFGASLWVMYMALEPFARRFWPRQLTSWTRLVAGDWRNPLVGRDLLLGMLVAGLVVALEQGTLWARLQYGTSPLIWTYPHGYRSLDGAAAALSNTLIWITPVIPLGLMLVLVTARLVFRRDALAVVAAGVALAAFSSLSDGITLSAVLAPAVFAVMGARLGLLSLLGGVLVVVNVELIPATFDPSLWWSASSWVGWMPLVALAIVCYRLAIRPTAEPS